MRLWLVGAAAAACSISAVMAEALAAPAGESNVEGRATVTTGVATTVEGNALLPGALSSADRPVGAEIRERLLADQDTAGDEEAVDWQGIIAFYEGRADEPLFVGKSGYTATANALVEEFARADDWGLDPKEFEYLTLPDAASGGAELTRKQQVDGELAFALTVLKYARHARGGRIPNPPKQLSSYLDRAPQYLDPRDVLVSIASSSDPAAALRGTNPKHPEFERLRQRYLALKSEANKASEVVAIPLDGPKLVPGMRHPDVALVRRRLGVPVPVPPASAQGGAASSAAEGQSAAPSPGAPDETYYDDDLAAAVAKFQDEKGEKPDGIVGRRTRSAFNDIVVPSPDRILANMEMWRWMPDDLGDLYVWVNIPEFMVRVVKGGEVVHEERIITGEVAKQTPIFDDQLETIYFNPRWNVPQSIKVLELYPSLARGGGSFERQGLVMTRNGRRIDPYSVNWSQVDIRNFDVYQPSGPGNALGIVKFTFPNKHAVYLHDTPTKHLFDAASRPFSHGCMRVRNPMRLAEILLAEDKGWSPEQVHDMQQSDPDEVPVAIDRRIPVHITYFTTRIGQDGVEQSFKDIYGHEERVELALAGAFDRIAVGPDHLAPVKYQRVQYYDGPDDWGLFFGGGPFQNNPKRRYKKNDSALNDFFENLFGGN